MTTPPTTTNEAATVVNKVISVLGNAGVIAVEALIISAQPWLGLPGIKQIWEFIFGYIMGYVITASEQGATFGVIDIQVHLEKNGISKTLAALVAAEKSGDQDAIKKARQDYLDAQSALMHDDGSAHAPG